MVNKELEVKKILSDLEAELKSLELWDIEEPTEEAFNSTCPFCVDTMELHEWLHFVFIRRMQDIFVSGAELPSKVKIFPYAYETLKGKRAMYTNLLRILYKLDAVFEDKD